MAPSPAKRRKLSPEPSTPKSAPNTPNRSQGSRDATQILLSRPSFASPTKASISRHNPQLLARSRSAGQMDQRSSSKENEAPTPLLVPPSKEMDAEGDTQVPHSSRISGEDANKAVPHEGGVPVTEQLASQGSALKSQGGGLSAPPRRRSRTPGKVVPRSSDSANRHSKSASGNGANQLTIGDRVIPPVPFRAAGLRRSPIPQQGLKVLEAVGTEGAEEPEEPQLPLTPTQRGLADPVVTTPPSGIHDTPSRRSKRPRAAKAKPSPLRSHQVSEVEAEMQAESESERVAKRQKATEVASRDLATIDPHAEQKKIRDQLLREVQELQADITLAEQENDRLHQYHMAGKGSVEPINPDKIVSLLVRSATALRPREPQSKPFSIFKSLASFLPFAPRPRPAKPDLSNVVPIPSHFPMPLEDPAPYLQLFTPLKFTSTVTILPSKHLSSTTTSAASPILQNHNITMSAASGLFSAQINMVVDTSRLSVSSLSIRSLDSSAEAEVGPWVRARASSRSILGRDVSAVCWGIARWYEVAMQRAKFWCEVERELGSNEGRRKSNSRLKAVAKRRKDDRPIEKESNKVNWTRKQLLPQMKRKNLVLGGTGVELRIEWNIIFDWTGEAESVISADASVPSSWQKEDDRSSLAKVPDTFDKLVKARGPMAAVRAMVALLMPS